MELSRALEIAPSATRRRIDASQGVLVGSRCSECHATSWPARAVCHRCGQPAMHETEFAKAGSLLTFTTVWVGPASLKTPYTIGQIRLDDGPLIFGHVRNLSDNATVPLPVRLVVGADPNVIPPFWFEQS